MIEGFTQAQLELIHRETKAELSAVFCFENGFGPQLHESEAAYIAGLIRDRLSGLSHKEDKVEKYFDGHSQ